MLRKHAWALSLGFLAVTVMTSSGCRRTISPLSYPRIPAVAPVICYSCFWEGYFRELRPELVEFYHEYKTEDPLVSADVQYILWRATGIPNCDARENYRQVAARTGDLERRLTAYAILGFSGPECGEDSSESWVAAANLADQAGLKAKSAALRQMSRPGFQPSFGDMEIATSLSMPGGSRTMILGASSISLRPGLRLGTQVERVARDWISYRMKWDLTGRPLPAPLDYHEGDLVARMMRLVRLEVLPLAGTLLARQGEKWFAPDETGVFRFEILQDKMQYPTTHATGSFGWIQDTHGISALVSQALERRVDLVVGCGDSEGKMKAAFYLAQKGISVVFPGDRYQDLLLGYQAKGVLLGTAPVKMLDGRPVLGNQPIRFSLREPIVVEDTKQLFPIQYYDAPARYFRRLSQSIPLNVDYVEVDAADQIQKVLQRADQLGSHAVAVRVVTADEYEPLREWLDRSRSNRAILFHSGLYPYAQPLFAQYPQQVTFGDLHPQFE